MIAEMDRILAEVTNDMPPAVPDDGEQAAFRKAMQREVAEIKAIGGIVEIPSDIS